MPTFDRAGLVLSYEDLGGPSDRTVVFIHGLLLSAEMMEPIARRYAGVFRPILFDLHGHGRSSRPVEGRTYSMHEFSLDTVALLDHLKIERVGFFGTSLGADVSLEVMLDAPERVAGAVLEMPVLERGARFARRMFRPIAYMLRRRQASRALAFAARRMPDLRLYPGGKEALEILAENPVSGAAVIEGLLATAGRNRWADVDRCPVPALVIGHPRDPLHAFGDADELARRLPNGRLLKARSILELRLRPERLVDISRRFLEESFRDAEGRGSDVGPIAAS
jgi:pimeloyl-ACP methyl ester carboxylesterase